MVKESFIEHKEDAAFIRGWAAASNACIALASKQNTWTPELREATSPDNCLLALDCWRQKKAE